MFYTELLCATAVHTCISVAVVTRSKKDCKKKRWLSSACCKMIVSLLGLERGNLKIDDKKNDDYYSKQLRSLRDWRMV